MAGRKRKTGEQGSFSCLHINLRARCSDPVLAIAELDMATSENNIQESIAQVYIQILYAAESVRVNENTQSACPLQ